MSFKIYNASAGSGKTFGLVKDILINLFSAHQTREIDRILAVTFTNKAANEMKQRLIKELTDISRGKQTAMAANIQYSLNLPPETLQTKTAGILDYVLFHYDQLHFSTIDKWTLGLIKNFSRELGVSYSANVEIDDEARTREIIENYINTINEKNPAFRFLAGWIRQKIDDSYNWDITTDLQKLTYFLLPDSYADILESLQNEGPALIPGLHESLQTQIREIEQMLTASILEYKKGLKQYKDIISYYSRKENLLTKLAGDKSELLSSSNLKSATFGDLFIETIDFCKKNKSIPPSGKAHLENLRTNILHAYRQYVWLSAVRKGLRPLVLFEEILREVNRYKEENDIIFISDFNKIVRRVVRNNPAPFIYWRLGQKLKYHFIDEFQDTSVIQWENFLPMLEEIFSGTFSQTNPGGVTLFGDAKQSIYRFRGARPEQFIKLSLPPSNPESKNPFPVEKDVIRMGTNYRSLPAIVNFNNRFFSYAGEKLKEDLYRSVYAVQNLHQTPARSDLEGYVEINYTPKPPKDEEKDYQEIYLNKLVKQIRDLYRRGFAWKDIAVLFPRNKDGATIAEKLNEENIPAVSSDSLVLELSSKVQLLIRLLTERRHPSLENRFELIQYYATVKQSEINKEFFDRMKDLSFGQLMQELSQKPDAGQIPWTRLSLPDFFASAYDILDLKQGGEDAYVQFFMDLVRQNNRQLSDTSFLQEWNGHLSRKPIPANESLDAVRLMSIHKSKGLEFPAVIFAFPKYSTKPGGNSNRPNYVWIDTQNQNGLPPYIPLNLNDISKFSLLGESLFARIYNEEVSRSLFDTTNLYYVAMTRARDELYVMLYDIPKSGKNDETKDFQQILQTYIENQPGYDKENLRYSLGSKTTGQKKQSLSSGGADIPTRYRHLDWNQAPFLLRATKFSGTTGHEAIHQGRQIHQWLARIRYQTDLERYGKALNAHPHTAKIIKEIILHPKLNAYFTPPYRVYNERSIGQIRPGEILTRRPDRICVHPQSGHTVIIDYKTGKPRQSHRDQVAGYVKMLREANYNVTTALLVYIDDGGIKVEETAV